MNNNQTKQQQQQKIFLNMEYYFMRTKRLTGENCSAHVVTAVTKIKR